MNQRVSGRLMVGQCVPRRCCEGRSDAGEQREREATYKRKGRVYLPSRAARQSLRPERRMSMHIHPRLLDCTTTSLAHWNLMGGNGRADVHASTGSLVCGVRRGRLPPRGPLSLSSNNQQYTHNLAIPDSACARFSASISGLAGKPSALLLVFALATLVVLCS